MSLFYFVLTVDFKILFKYNTTS